MTSVLEMNAIVTDRARIREGIMTLTDITLHRKDARVSGKVYIERGEVLALLTPNILPAKENHNEKSN